MNFAKFVQFAVVYIGELCGLNELPVSIIIRIIGLIRRCYKSLCRYSYHFWVHGILLCSNDFLPKLIKSPKSMPLAFR